MGVHRVRFAITIQRARARGSDGGPLWISAGDIGVKGAVETRAHGHCTVCRTPRVSRASRSVMRSHIHGVMRADHPT